MTGGADPVLRVQRREALELLAEEIEAWGRTLAALYLFGADGVLTGIAA